MNTGGGRGAGLIVYTRSGIAILKIDKPILLFQLYSFKVNDVTINLVYRSPRATPELVAELANNISEAKKNEIFIGDFDPSGINWAGGGRNAVFVEAVENGLVQQLVEFLPRSRAIFWT